jgi:hypothetical protein
MNVWIISMVSLIFFIHFVVYLTPSVSQYSQIILPFDIMVGWLVNNELEQIWKDAVMV